eukprot:GEMP01017925.1.p1 GENE.GEMP01017925.1~~GEMP01017925.1.p1  ORF type:complete len:371 (+),score=51.20 GEMP01017925.1:74-1186(+)
MQGEKRDRANSRNSWHGSDRGDWNNSWNGRYNNWNTSSWSSSCWQPRQDEDRKDGPPPKEKNYDFKPGVLNCKAPHEPRELVDILNKEDMAMLREIWDQLTLPFAVLRDHAVLTVSVVWFRQLIVCSGACSSGATFYILLLLRSYHDDLDNPKLEAKPILTPEHLNAYHQIALKAVQRVADCRNESLSLDQATISATSSFGHKRHADNLVFGVWRYGERVSGPVEQEIEEARKDGAEVWWRPNTTCHRNYAITINLVDPADFEGGVVSFYRTLGAYEPYAKYKANAGCGVAFCGCDECIHSVEGVTKGFRLCLLMWTRAAGTITPQKSKRMHYHRPGTGDAVWLTLADLPEDLQDVVRHPSRSPSPAESN